MVFDPDAQHRRSFRLKGFDYSADGAYFVTVCAQGRECLFGRIVNGGMELNEAGWMVETWWREMSNKFPSVGIDTFVVMPNHFHGIVCIVGATLCGRPVADKEEGRPHRVAPTLGDIIDWFKTMTTNAYIRGVKQSNWPSFPGRLWQRNYYERIIRDEVEFDAIRKYIVENPMKWVEDTENPSNVP
jgi:putative transposase